MKTFKTGAVFFSEKEDIYGVVVNDTQSVTTKKGNHELDQVLTIDNSDIPEDAIIMEYGDILDISSQGIIICLGIHYTAS